MGTSFAIIKGDQYLQGLMINDKYNKTTKGGTQSTAFTRHNESEFTPVFGNEIKYFDIRTTRGYLDILLEGIRWGEINCHDIKISVLRS